MSNLDDFIAGLHADVVIPLHEPGRALSVVESLALRDFYDRRQALLRAIDRFRAFEMQTGEDPVKDNFSTLLRARNARRALVKAVDQFRVYETLEEHMTTAHHQTWDRRRPDGSLRPLHVLELIHEAEHQHNPQDHTHE